MELFQGVWLFEKLRIILSNYLSNYFQSQANFKKTFVLKSRALSKLFGLSQENRTMPTSLWYYLLLWQGIKENADLFKEALEQHELNIEFEVRGFKPECFHQNIFKMCESTIPPE